MGNDFTILIEYKNKDLQKVGERVYGFQEYVDLLNLELKKVIVDVEDAFYELENDKPKEEWSEGTANAFRKIRHKLLDQANSVQRIPQMLRYKGVPCNTRNLRDVIAEFMKENYK